MAQCDNQGKAGGSERNVRNAEGMTLPRLEHVHVTVHGDAHRTCELVRSHGRSNGERHRPRLLPAEPTSEALHLMKKKKGKKIVDDKQGQRRQTRVAVEETGSSNWQQQLAAATGSSSSSKTS